mgnify:CR=1 FL=1
MLTVNIIVAAAVFCLLCALWLAGLFIWSLRMSVKERALAERLGVKTKGRGTKVLRLWHDGGMAMTAVPEGSSPRLWLRYLHNAAGFEAELSAVLLGLMGSCALSAAITHFLTKNYIMTAACPVLIVVIFRMYVGFRISRRDALFEKQFIDALELAARSLKAGHPLLGAFELIAQEMPDPVRPVFASICQQHSMGVGLEDAILRVAANHTSQDLKLFSTAVAIQIRTGGNLAAVMERLADVIRDRVRLGRRVRVLTAQTQFSKRVLIALPWMLFFMLNAVNPRYMGMLYTTTDGQLMLAAGFACLILGWFMMNRLSILKY